MANATEAHNHEQVHSNIPLDTESYSIAPSELSLEQVHVYVRHGERTPVRVRMAEPPASINPHWNLCRTARQFRASVATFGDAVQDSLRSSDGIEFLPVKRVVEREDGNTMEGECLLGELTDMGRQTTYNFGRSLRKIYVEKLGFLPDTLSSNSDGYFRSTNMPRTIESLQQVMHGLYPRSKLAHGVIPQLRVRNGLDENLVPNTFACKRLEVLLVGFAQAAAAAYNHTLEPLDEKLSKYIGGNPIRIDGQPRASGILDTIRASVANGIDVPPEFKEKSVMDLIEKAVVTEWFADRTEEVRRLGMGRLLDDLVSKMNLKAGLKVQQTSSESSASASSSSSSLFSSATGKIGLKSSSSKLKGDETSARVSGTGLEDGVSPKILVHSTHDTALAALLATLDVFDEKWPLFTASITFELFKKRSETIEGQQRTYLQTVLNALPSFPFGGKKESAVEHYVRVRYQNQSLSLPFCSGKGDHLDGYPDLCTFEAFKRRMNEIVLRGRDWEMACAQRGNASSVGANTGANGGAGIVNNVGGEGKPGAVPVRK